MNWLDCSEYLAMFQNPKKLKLLGRIAKRSPARPATGLTLVELLISMAIMGIMAAMRSPALTPRDRKSCWRREVSALSSFQESLRSTLSSP